MRWQSMNSEKPGCADSRPAASNPCAVRFDWTSAWRGWAIGRSCSLSSPTGRKRSTASTHCDRPAPGVALNGLIKNCFGTCSASQSMPFLPTGSLCCVRRFNPTLFSMGCGCSVPRWRRLAERRIASTLDWFECHTSSCKKCSCPMTHSPDAYLRTSRRCASPRTLLEPSYGSRPRRSTRIF